MKRIFACLDPDNFYTLDLSDETLSEVTLAQAWLQGCQFDGELWIHTTAKHLNTKNYVDCRLVIRTDRVGALVKNFFREEDLLEYQDNLLALPDIYLTRRFRIMEQDAEKYLSTSNTQLIATWHVVQGNVELEIN